MSTDEKQVERVNRGILRNTGGVRGEPASTFGRGEHSGESLVANRRPSREIAQWRDRNK
jgi:hypothetical protein